MVRVVGHRGAAGLEPENTLRAVRRAIDLGVDQVEIDVQLTRDGKLAVIHDKIVDRTTDGQGAVNDLTFEELRRLNAGDGERIPSLEEVMEVVLGRAILQIELKRDEPTPGPVLAVIRELKAQEDVVVSSVKFGLLEQVRRMEPRVATLGLFSQLKDLQRFDEAYSAWPDDMYRICSRTGCRWLGIWARAMTGGIVQEAHRRGLLVYCFGAHEKEDLEHVASMGVEAIGTNRPDILLRILGR